MLRSTLAAVVFGASLWAFAWLGALGEPIARAGAAVAIGILVTALAYGQATFLSIGVGALSPLAFSLLERHSLGLAATVLCSIWMLPRLVLAPSTRLIGLLAALSIAAAAVAGFVFAAYVGAGVAAELASCLFAGSCLSLVGLVPVDTGVAFALRTAAAAIDSPARQTLERAARLHRQSHASPSQWRALGRLADERAALQHGKATENESARKDLDERIETLAADLAPVDPASSPAVMMGPSEAAPAEATPAEAAPAEAAPAEAAPTEVSSETHASDQVEITVE